MTPDRTPPAGAPATTEPDPTVEPEGESFAGQLAGARHAALLTQEQLARRTGLSVRTLRYLESGHGRPRRVSAQLLADGLGLTGVERRRFLAAARGPADAERGRPAQLPPDVPDLTGRTTAAGTVRDALAPAGPDASTVPLAVVSGPAGVGKTALAVHVAHLLRAEGRFPDGQLFADLRGVGDEPADPADVAAGMLRALGAAPETVPADPDERAAALRGRLAERAVLIVLDNAGGAAQVRPLLPAGPRCGVLVTSRAPLPELEGGTGVDLAVLSEAEAVDLLGRVAGADRVAAEAAAARRLAAQCGGLPLALRITGSRLAARPRWPLSWLADRLTDERRRLDELLAGDLDVRAGLELAYGALTGPDRRLLRLLADLWTPEFGSWPAAALLDSGPDAAEDAVERLVDARLLDPSGFAAGQPRYRFHDLVRLFGREKAAVEQEPGDAAAVRRVLSGCLVLAESLDALLPSPGLGTGHGVAPRWPLVERMPELLEEPAARLEVDRAMLLGAVERAAELGDDELAWDLASSLRTSLMTRGELVDWERVQDAALAVTRAAGNRRGEAQLLRGLGQLRIEQDDPAAAEVPIERSLALFTELGDEVGAAHSRISLGVAAHGQGQLDRAKALFSAGREVLDRRGDRQAVGYTSYTLGVIARMQGDLPTARRLLEDAIAGHRATGDRRMESWSMRSLGQVHLDAGDPDEARACWLQALPVAQAVGDRFSAAMARQSIAEVHPDRVEGIRLAEQAYADCAELGSVFGQARAHHLLGTLRLAAAEEAAGPEAAAGRAAAERDLRRADELWVRLGVPLWRARTAVALGDLHAARGERDAAEEQWRRGIALVGDTGAPAQVVAAATARLAAAGHAAAGHAAASARA